MKLGKYRKLVVAVIGVGLMSLEMFADISLPYDAEQIVKVAGVLLATAGVYQAKNDA